MKVTIVEGRETMSSLEIAELTGKRHDHVIRDIEKTLDEAGIHHPIFGDIYKDSNNRERKCFNLPRRECDLVISGYSVKYRLAIIDRWHELEAEKATAIPENFADALQLAADIQRKLQIAVETKAEIGSRREATSMNTASQAIKKSNKLDIELDKSKEYCSVKRMQMICHGQKFDWRFLKSTANEMEVESIDVFDSNYGTVKSYHKSVWMEAYGLEV